MITEPIDSEPLRKFCDEQLRPFCDLFSGLLPLPKQILDTFVGKDLAVLVGTTPEEILRAEPWVDTDYMATGAPQVIVGAGSGGRSERTHYHVIAILRVLAVLRQLLEANPDLGPLVRGWAVNSLNINLNQRP